MQALIGGRNAGGLKRENTRAWPAVKTGVDWLKQRACSVRRHGAGGVKRNKTEAGAGADWAEAAGSVGPEAWHR